MKRFIYGVVGALIASTAVGLTGPAFAGDIGQAECLAMQTEANDYSRTVRIEVSRNREAAGPWVDVPGSNLQRRSVPAVFRHEARNSQDKKICSYLVDSSVTEERTKP